MKNSTLKKSKRLNNYIKKAKGLGVGITAMTMATSMVTLTMLGAYALSSSINIAYAAQKQVGVVNDGITSLRIRTSTDTSSTSNVITRVNGGFTFEVLDTVNGGSWYHIGFTLNDQYTTGYISGSSEYVTITTIDDGSGEGGNTGDDSSNVDFEQYMNDQGFPESYKGGLRALHEQYPQWVFIAEHINKNWDEIIDNQCATGRSLINGSAINSWKSTAEDVYNWDTGEWTELDSGGWVQASRALVEYAVDPRNFLNGTNVFMFENLSYNSSLQSESGVNNIIAGSFMDNSSHNLEYDGQTYTYASGLILAGQRSGVSPYHLATRIIQEQGYNGQGRSISGTVAGYEGIFNYYNQGAYKTSDASAVVNGLKFASIEDASTLRAWNSRMKSIIGGAIYLGKNYINRGQNTLYYEKFDFVTPYSHQYMTYVLAPRQESVTACKAYSDEVKDSTALIFTIPVYNNMPENICSIPTSNSILDNGENGGSNPDSGDDGSGDDGGTGSDDNNGNNNGGEGDGNGEESTGYTGAAVAEDGSIIYYRNDELIADYNGMAVDATTGKKYWFDYGVAARDKEVYDPESDAWYWFDADATMATNKDAYVWNADHTDGKWVRYDENGGMVKGEDNRYGGWYLFDQITGEMLKGFINIPDGTDEGKMVYYDLVNGQMHHGESFIDGSWYRFDEVTGGIIRGEYCNGDGYWYLYDDETGIMQYGEIYYNGNWYYYDEITGVMQHGDVFYNDEWHHYDDVTGILQP